MSDALDNRTAHPPRRTALDALHRALGATMTDFAGWDMPLRYASEREEHQAVRTRAGLFDLSHMGEITVTGQEAGQALDHALVGHLSALAVGRARYTMVCAPDGGILDDLIVYRLAEQEYLIVANASNAQTVLDAVTGRAAGFDAEVRDDRDAYALLAVQGAVGAIQAIKQLGLSGKVALYAFCAASTKLDKSLYRACAAQEPAAYAQIVVTQVKTFLSGKAVKKTLLSPLKVFVAPQTPGPGEVG